MPEYNVPADKNFEAVCPCGRIFLTSDSTQPFCPVCKMDIDAEEAACQ